jgi:TraX protein.
MGLNSFQLKCIAVLTMIIDHTGAVLFPGDLVFRYIGRISFPIFCFLLVEGFSHTRDMRKYMLRLGVFAVISEIPYDLAFRDTVLEFGHQNVFFSLFIGVVMMYALEKNAEWPIKVTEVLLAMWVAVFLRTDYGFKGILLISNYYFLRRYRWRKHVAGAVWNLLWNQIQRYGVFATVFLVLYNGEKGPSMKYFFYLFYPLHLLVLYAIYHMIR